jgi:hypothetical protein
MAIGYKLLVLYAFINVTNKQTANERVNQTIVYIGPAQLLWRPTKDCCAFVQAHQQETGWGYNIIEGIYIDRLPPSQLLICMSDCRLLLCETLSIHCWMDVYNTDSLAIGEPNTLRVYYNMPSCAYNIRTYNM